MRLNKTIILVLAAVVMLALACRLEEPDVQQTMTSSFETTTMSRMMAIGDNFLAGYQNGALVHTHQAYSIPNLIAQQSAVEDFVQPLIAYPGLGQAFFEGAGVFKLLYLDNPATPQTVNPDFVITAVPLDTAVNWADNPYHDPDLKTYPAPYNNLAIPGIYLEDILIAKTELQSSSKSPLIPPVLRNTLGGGGFNMTAFQQVKAFFPTVVLCWAGMYDVMDYAYFKLNGTNLESPTDPQKFSDTYAALMDSLQTVPSAAGGVTNVIVANIPDISKMPYFNTIPPYVVDTLTNTLYLENGNPVPLVGVNPVTDKVLLPGKTHMQNTGNGIPAGIMNGTGDPLPDEFFLDLDELAVIQETIMQYNVAIDSICDNRGIPVVDMYTFFEQVSQGAVQVGGFAPSDQYVIGGFYSLDGIHPSNIGYAMIANKWIETINQSLSISLPFVNVVELMRE